MPIMFDSLKLFGGIFESMQNAYKEFDVIQNINRINMNYIEKANITDIVLHDITNSSVKALRSLNLEMFNMFPLEDIKKSVFMQWESISKIPLSRGTPEIKKLRDNFAMNNIIGGIESFIPAVSGRIVFAPNIAFLKQATLFTRSIEPELPIGLKTIIKDMNIITAKHLSSSSTIVLDVKDKCFYDDNNPFDTASISETNIICSGVEVLAEITESELINFLCYISAYPNFAIEHKVAKKIYNIISSWNYLIDFDYNMYYHARSLNNNDCPYNDAELLRAPTGVTWHGRYNYIGESHYYFSNNSKGAVIEVKKHSDPRKRIQVIKLEPRKRIAMIDLSQNKSRNKFLEFCRFSPEPGDYRNIKREYLIPCFVASCCKKCDIEGIKYYGSSEYYNYVSWSDGYFKCTGSYID